MTTTKLTPPSQKS